MFNEVINEIYTAVRYNHYACGDNDLMRAATNYGEFSGYVAVLHMMGHEVTEGCTIEDSGCPCVSYFKFDDKVLLEKGNWQKVFWDDYAGALEL